MGNKRRRTRRRKKRTRSRKGRGRGKKKGKAAAPPTGPRARWTSGKKVRRRRSSPYSGRRAPRSTVKISKFAPTTSNGNATKTQKQIDKLESYKRHGLSDKKIMVKIKPEHKIAEDLHRGQEKAAHGGLERIKEKEQSDEYQKKKIASQKGNRAAKKSYDRLMQRREIAEWKLKRAQENLKDHEENADYTEARAAVPTKKDSGCIIS
jgi:hypothetical protein